MNMNISETSGPIVIKYYLKHHWGGGKAALGFGADQVRTLVSMATNSSHRVNNGENDVITCSQLRLIGSLLAGHNDIHKNLDGFEILSNQITDYGVSCP